MLDVVSVPARVSLNPLPEKALLRTLTWLLISLAVSPAPGAVRDDVVDLILVAAKAAAAVASRAWLLADLG